MALSRPSSEVAPAGAFTLVELLVVIAMIGLLVALLLPAIRKARQQTLDVHCASQLRQNGIGIAAYAINNNGWAPANDMPGDTIYTPAPSLTGPVVTWNYPNNCTGLGLLYSCGFTRPARLFWCASEDAASKINGSEHPKYGHKPIVATPPGSLIRLRADRDSIAFPSE